MIWIRRFFALLLGVLFLPLLLATLFFLHVNDTFLKAEFYVNELGKADPFNFLYDELIPVVVDEIGPLEVGETSLKMDRLAEKGVTFLRDVFPPDWLQ